MSGRRHHGPLLSLTVLAVFALGYASGVAIGWLPRGEPMVIEVPDDGPRAAVVGDRRHVFGPRPSAASKLLVLQGSLSREGRQSWSIEQDLVGIERLRSSTPWRSVEFASGYDGRRIRFWWSDEGCEVEARYRSCSVDDEALVIGSASAVSVDAHSLRFDLLVVLPDRAHVERWVGWLGPVDETFGWSEVAAAESR